MRNYPAKVRDALEKKGFFAMTSEERIKQSLKHFRNFAFSGKGDYEAGRKALLEIRGEERRELTYMHLANNFANEMLIKDEKPR